MSFRVRDCRFDNLKGLLIFLVVLGHTLPKFQNDFPTLSRCILSVIYSFHMPAFIFISGYFSKNVSLSDQYSRKIVKTILIPFILAHSLVWLLTSRSIASFFSPRTTLWYLLCLFLWKLIVTPVSKLRFAIIFSVVISILVGFSPADRVLSLSRIVAFFPFFLAGYFTAPAAIDRIRKIPKAVPALILLLSFSAVILMARKNLPLLDIFQFADPYDTIEGASRLQCMLLRSVSLLIGFISTACLLVLIPQRPCFLSSLGRYTMTVYLGHSSLLAVIVKLISMIFPAVRASELLVIAVSFALSVLVCFLLGNSWIDSLYNKALDWTANLVLVKDKQTLDGSE